MMCMPGQILPRRGSMLGLVTIGLGPSVGSRELESSSSTLSQFNRDSIGVI